MNLELNVTLTASPSLEALVEKLIAAVSGEQFQRGIKISNEGTVSMQEEPTEKVAEKPKARKSSKAAQVRTDMTAEAMQEAPKTEESKPQNEQGLPDSEELRALCVQLARDGKRKEAKDALTSHGVESIGELMETAPENIHSFHATLKALIYG
ncbi:hypothetical protein [Bacteroides sedimenti]